MRNRIISVLLIAAFLCSFVGCTKNEKKENAVSKTEQTTAETRGNTTTTQTKPVKDIKTPGVCYAASDSVSPYKAQTRVNQQLCGFLYEGLTKIEEDWTTSLCLAGSIQEVSRTVYTISLRSKAKFSNGSEVTAADVVSSWKQAQNCALYQNLVSDIRNVVADGKNKVQVSFYTAVPWTKRALSFPIVKDTLGTGPYYFNGKKKSLVANPYAKEKPAISSWRLENIPRDSNQQYALESEHIQCFFTDLYSCELSRIQSVSQMQKVLLPYLVYMGMNTNREPWNSVAVRQILSDGISRKAVGAAGCSGYCEFASSILPTTMKDVAKLEGFYPDAQEGTVLAELKKQTKAISGELLVPKENVSLVSAAKEIAKGYKEYGIFIKVVSVEYGTYCSRLSSGNFDLYLGEIRLPNTLSLDALLSSGGAASYGVSETGRKDYAKYKEGKLNAQAFHESFLKEIPLIPLVWEQGVLMASSQLSKVNATGAQPYNDVSQWKWK